MTSSSLNAADRVKAASQPLAETLLEVLQRVVGPSPGLVPLHEPEFGDQERAYVDDCIDSTFVSSVGSYVDRFEAMLAAATGARHAVAVVNGTAALQIALRLAGVVEGDEVLVPALSFVATANAVAHCGAVPHFVDSDPDTMGMAAAPLATHLDEIAERTVGGWRNRRTGRRIAAVVPMHTYGHPVAIDELLDVAQRHDLPVVEDAAESLGSRYRGKHTGTFGTLGILSFNGNKIVTTGGGGAILTDDEELARRAKHLTTTAKVPHRFLFFHDEVAWNYRLPNLNAALGCGQLERLPDMLTRKRALAERYRAELEGRTGVRFMLEPPDTTSNYWLNTVRLETSDLAVRDSVLDTLNEAGYQCRPAWTLLHKLPMHEACPRAPLEVAERLEASLVNLPSSARWAPAP